MEIWVPRVYSSNLPFFHGAASDMLIFQHHVQLDIKTRVRRLSHQAAATEPLGLLVYIQTLGAPHWAMYVVKHPKNPQAHQMHSIQWNSQSQHPHWPWLSGLTRQECLDAFARRENTLFKRWTRDHTVVDALINTQTLYA